MQTKKYEFCAVEEFKSFVWEKSELRREVKIVGIRQIHHISYSGGCLKTSKLSCLTFLKLQLECDSCRQQPFTLSAEKLAKLLAKDAVQGEPEDKDVHCELEEEQETLEMSDNECDGEGSRISDKELENEEEIDVGDIVWGLWYGKRAPAKTSKEQRRSLNEYFP